MLKSSKSYVPGDVIHAEKPWIYILAAGERGKRCNNCFESSRFVKACSRCHIVYYCGKECQRKDWLAHHKHSECKVFKEAASSELKGVLNTETELLAIRVFLTLRGRPDLRTVMFELSDGSKKCFNDLMTNMEGLLKNEQKIMNVARIKVLLKKIIPNVDEDEFLETFGKVRTNNYSLYTDLDALLGHAVSVVYAQFNHSCKPNALPVSAGLNQWVRALSKIPAGEEITISYINPLETREKRRSWLKSNWDFDCECVRVKIMMMTMLTRSIVWSK